jgi:hypothetical protein
MCRGDTSSETTGILGAFDLEAAKLLDFSVSNSTRRVYENYFLMIKDFAISSLPCVLNLKLTPEIYALTVDGE